MLEEILQQRCLLTPAKPLVVGVSGGPDSLCLLGILHEAGYPLIVAHFNHKLRPEADQEAEAVEKQSRGMGFPVVVDSVDVHKWAEQEGYSIEEAARIQRYRFLFKIARLEAAQAVAVGHTADDQVETVLMHFLRGAGLAGLKGMPYRLVLPVFDSSIPLVRPLLSLWRQDTEKYCADHGLRTHFDSSNLDQSYFRNHLRLSVIPELEKNNPRFKEAVLRTAMTLQGDYDLLQHVLEEQWALVIDSTGDGWITFDEDKLAACEPSLQRNLLRRAGQILRPGSRDIGYDVLERAGTFLQDASGRRMDFVNGLFLEIDNGKVTLATYEADMREDNLFALPGEVTFRAGDEVELGKDWQLISKVIDTGEDDWKKNEDAWSAWLDLEKTGEVFTIRTRQAGDIFRPLGMGGQSVKVREFFINNKIPRKQRDGWPIVCADEEIAWIPGIRIAHTYRLTQKTGKVVRMIMTKLPAED